MINENQKEINLSSEKSSEQLFLIEMTNLLKQMRVINEGNRIIISEIVCHNNILARIETKIEAIERQTLQEEKIL